MIDTRISLPEINSRSLLNMGQHLGIEFTEIHEDYLEARMPVDHRTTQPLGLLNGGASAAFAELAGSMGAYLSVDRDQYYCLGMEIKCNHLRATQGGYVYAKASPLHVGKKTHLWKVEIRDEANNLVAFATHTVMVVELTEEMRVKFKDLFLRPGR